MIRHKIKSVKNVFLLAIIVMEFFKTIAYPAFSSRLLQTTVTAFASTDNGSILQYALLAIIRALNAPMGLLKYNVILALLKLQLLDCPLILTISVYVKVNIMTMDPVKIAKNVICVVRIVFFQAPIAPLALQVHTQIPRPNVSNVYLCFSLKI